MKNNKGNKRNQKKKDSKRINEQKKICMFIFCYISIKKILNV